MATNQSNEEITSQAARDTANALRNYAAIVYGIATTSGDRDFQNCQAETRIEIVSTMKSITSSSYYFLTKTKTICQDYSVPQAQNSMVAAARDFIESLNEMINVFTITVLGNI